MGAMGRRLPSSNQSYHNFQHPLHTDISLYADHNECLVHSEVPESSMVRITKDECIGLGRTHSLQNKSLLQRIHGDIRPLYDAKFNWFDLCVGF